VAVPSGYGDGKRPALSYNRISMESPEPSWNADRLTAAVTPVSLPQAMRRALAFFTRLPVMEAGSEPLAACVLAFAPVGALIGLTVGLANLVARGLGLPALLAALFALSIGIVLTGALHEDGLADSADALGGTDVAARLSIMRDSRSGTYGVLALIFSVTLRGAAIAALQPGAALFVLIGAHALSRGGLAAMMHGMQPARRDGLGADAGQPALDQAQLAVAIGAAILVITSLFASLLAGLLALVVAGAAGLLLAALANRKLGGYTGDVLGALQQGVEIAVLASFSLWIGF
jgi:adenosylcobinamide-GDP ribazoletransferase